MQNIPIALALLQQIFTLLMAIHIKNAMAVVAKLALLITSITSFGELYGTHTHLQYKTDIYR